MGRGLRGSYEAEMQNVRDLSMYLNISLVGVKSEGGHAVVAESSGLEFCLQKFLHTSLIKHLRYSYFS